MNFISIYGGLGNQMFQYAFGRSLSINSNLDFKIDIYKMGNSNFISRDFLLSKFNIKKNIANIEEVDKFHFNKYVDFFCRKLFVNNVPITDKIYEKAYFKFDSSLFNFPKDNSICYFDGYWQSFKYFSEIRPLLLKEFTLINDFNFDNQFILNKIKNSNSVSIHIRRGDYVKDKKNNKIYNVFGLEYYEAAINYINKIVENPVFFVFSDDLDWVKSNLSILSPYYVDVNSFENPENDLILMSSCKHNIIANSTFSWWGAWLNDNERKHVIAPKRWMSTIDCLDDLYPESWIKL